MELVMRKASRLFEIIQILRVARRPITAAAIAERLEITVRSIYRDIAALQAMRVPIDGERGIGYILRPGFDLPPLMFTIEETEAVVLGLALIERTGDKELTEAAKKVANKIAAAVPQPLRQLVSARSLHAWGPIAPQPQNIDFTMIRRAIRDEEKLDIDYRDEQGRITQRIIRPLALIYYLDAAVIVGWCELRQAIRNFRLDRTQNCKETGLHFRNEGDALRNLWISGWKTQPAA
jgi:predicted DNA-binding transcriptional regulator YafY